MAKNTIKVKKYSDVVEEYAAAGAITPGMLIEVQSATTVGYHSTASGNALPMFALEDELQGKGITEAYAAADRVQCWVPYRGDIVYGILADGENASAGDFLESNGDGTLKVHVADSSGDIYTQAIVGVAVEAVDMSDSSGADPDGRIQVRIN